MAQAEDSGIALLQKGSARSFVLNCGAERLATRQWSAANDVL